MRVRRARDMGRLVRMLAVVAVMRMNGVLDLLDLGQALVQHLARHGFAHPSAQGQE